MKKTIISILVFMLLLTAFFHPQSVQVVDAAPAKDYTAKSYILMSEDGQILKEKNIDEKLPIASMTKVMTLILTFEELEKNTLTLDELVVASETAASMGGSQVFIEENGKYSIDSLIKSIVVASANDASVLMAERIAGSELEFVNHMNEKAKALKLTNTNFKNCTGLPAADHYSCARDLAVMFKELTKHNNYFNYSKIWMDKIDHPNDRYTEISNTNKLLKQYPLCDAGKTGSTSEAGFCISASAVKDDMRLYAVVIGSENSKDRFNKTKELFNYGFDNYTKSVIIPKDYSLNVEVEKGKESVCVAHVAEDFVFIIKKGDKQDIETKVVINKQSAPIVKGEEIGEILCVKNGEVIKTVKLLASTNIDKLSYWDFVKKTIQELYF